MQSPQTILISLHASKFMQISSKTLMDSLLGTTQKKSTRYLLITVCEQIEPTNYDVPEYLQLPPTQQGWYCFQ